MSNAGQYNILSGVLIDMTNDGWSEFKKWLNGTYAWLGYTWVADGANYHIIATDAQSTRICKLAYGDAGDFETNFKHNWPLTSPIWESRNKISRFGNLTASSTSEVLVCGRGYVEPAAQAQRSLVSTSVQDKPGGSGAAAVRVIFLNSNYELKTEDVTLNGTSSVDMVATDLRFVEELRVIQGTAAVGAVKLMTQTGGGGTEITGIGAATENAFLCHHYVPAGKRGWVTGWEVSIDDECSLKLKGQARYGANLVDENWDLRKLFQGNPTPPYRMEGSWKLDACPIGEKTYVRVTATPNQNTSTVVRARLYLWEE